MAAEPIVRYLNVDVTASNGNIKTGVAATGAGPADYWNFYNLQTGSITGEPNGPRWSDKTASGIKLFVPALGAWGTGSDDPMMHTYGYTAARITTLLTNFPACNVDVYVYAHGAATENASVSVAVNGVGQAAKITSASANWDTPGWTESNEYVVFRNLEMPEGGKLQIHCDPAAANNAVINGFQIVARFPPPITAPTITAQPSSGTVFAGDTVQLRVTAEGSQLAYQWRFNDTPIEGKTAATLEIPNFSAGNTGRYSVRVSNPAGEEVSRQVTWAVGTRHEGQLLAVDYTAHLNPAFSVQTGPAAIGVTSTDFWNVYSRDVSSQFDWRDGGIVSNLKWTDGTSSDATLTVTNAAGAWVVNSGGAMMESYLYPRSRQGQIVSTFSGLPANYYDVYVYAHGQPPTENARITILVDGATAGSASTSDQSGWDNAAWINGNQYVLFKGVGVAAGRKLQVISSAASADIAVINGIQLAVTPSPAPRFLNVDFGVITPALKTGVAATGSGPSDFWNLFDRDANRVVNAPNGLKWSDGADTSAQVTVQNGGGAWGSGASDIMMHTYLYPLSRSNNLVASFTAFPVGAYDVYVYAHGLPASENGVIELRSGGRTYGPKATSSASNWDAPGWVEGNEYVVFKNVAVGANRELQIVSMPGESSLAVLNGVQFAPATIPPKILEHPVAGTAFAGDTVSINVTAEGSSLNYQWFLNDVPLQGKTSPNLEIVNFSMANVGRYSVRVSNAMGEEMSDSATWALALRHAGKVLAVDYTAHLNPAFSVQTGPAAIGVSNSDFWNVYSRDLSNLFDWRSSGVVTNLKWSDNTASGASLAVENAAGAWIAFSGGPMMESYLYPLDRTGDIISTFSNLPAQSYDVYVYAHGQTTAENSTLTASIDGVLVDAASTSAQSGWDNAAWIEGNQFIVFRGIEVAAGQKLQINSSESMSDIAVINGLQLAAKPSALRIITQPQTQTVLFGGAINLSVQAEGTGTLNYQWSRNGVAIAGANRRELDIPTAQASDAGSYAVRVRNESGVVVSQNAVVVVNNAPPATARFLNVDFGVVTPNIKTGVAAVGNGPSDFWNLFDRDANAVVNAPSGLKWSDGTLAGARVSVQNGGGAWGNDAADIMLHTYLYPITRSGDIVASFTAIPPGVYDIYVYAHGLPANENGVIELRANGVTYGAKSTSTALDWDALGWWEGNEYVVFRNVTVASNGETQIIAMPGQSGLSVLNGAQFVSARTVTAPVIVTQPKAGTVFSGDTVAISVTAEGSSLQYQWKFDGAALPGANSASMEIPNFSAQNVGAYSVVVSNSAGAIESKKVNWSIGSRVAGPLLDIDYTAHLNKYFSTKSGPAAVGVAASDFWNVYSRDVSSEWDWRSSGTVANLKWANGTDSGASLSVQNAEGAWFTLASDPMLESYLYPLNGAAEIVSRLSNLPPQRYDIYVYAHGQPPGENARITLKVGGTAIASQTTGSQANWGDAAWAEGKQFVVFRGIHVVAGADVEIVSTGGDNGLPVINGIQLHAQTGPAVGQQPGATVTRNLLNVDYATTADFGSKVGPAAIGLTAEDHWNVYSRDTQGPVNAPDGLRWSDGALSGIRVTAENATGAWGTGSTDPMLHTYLYPGPGVNLTTTFTEFPGGGYDIYVYAHGLPADENSVIDLLVNGVLLETKSTIVAADWDTAGWTEGREYVLFAGVEVPTNGTVKIISKPGAKNLAVINGVQFLSTPLTPTPPQITLQPQGGALFVGKTLKLNVFTAGSRPFTYQWQLDGVDLTNSTRIAGAQASELQISTLALTDQGKYRVKISNALGETLSEEAIITVSEDVQAPAISITSPTEGAQAVPTYNLQGTITDNDSIQSLRWERNGVAMGALAVGSGTFSVPNLRFDPGETRIKVIATDPSGNTSSAEVIATWIAPRALVIASVPSQQEGSRFSVPISLVSTGGVSGATFTVSFDTNYLAEADIKFTDAVAGDFKSVTMPLPRQLQISFLRTGGTYPAGQIQVATATFRARSVSSTAASQLRIESTASIYDKDGNAFSAFGNTLVNSSVTVIKRKYTADNNANDRLDVGDGTLMLRLALRQDPVRIWDRSGNDLNKNGDIDPADVTRALRVVVGLDAQPGPVVVPPNLPTLSGVLVADKLGAAPGEKVTVDVRVGANAKPVTGASFRLEYPAEALRLENAEAIALGPIVRSGSVSVWNLSPAQNDFAAQNGVFAFAVSSTNAWAQTEGTFLRLTFTVQAAATTRFAWPLRLSNLEVSRDGYETEMLGNAGIIFEGRAAPQPTLSNVTFRTDGTPIIQFQGEPDASYTIEASLDMIFWENLGEHSSATGAVTVQDTRANGAPFRFYRAKVAGH